MYGEIKVTQVSSRKPKPDYNNLGFGKYFTDHMFTMDFSDEKGWHNPEICPYGNLELAPSAMVLHYGQAVFEGMKAYKTKSGDVQLFRPQQNLKRLNISNERVCIPSLDVDFALNAIKELVKLDSEWIPTDEGKSLYIRPFVIAVDPFLGVRPSCTFKFIVILSPVGSYYPEGINPVKIYVEPNYVRAVRGGTGYAKTAGNYAASLKAQLEAKKLGYSQVLWLDALERKYVEEVGTMNVFFKINGEIITAALEGTLLPGITRESAIELLKSWGEKVVERKLSIEEIYDAQKKGILEEAFGTGTAAVISPIGELNWNGDIITINNNEIGEVSKKLYDTLTGIQCGDVEDIFNWNVKI